MIAALLLATGTVVAAQEEAQSTPFALNGSIAVPVAPGHWVDPIDDYPARARRDGQDGGSVVARVFVIGTGRVIGCLILQHAQAPVFETSTCRMLRTRARFVAFSGGGLATYDYRIVWDLSRLPPMRPISLEPIVMRMPVVGQ